jgi:hypothetical protein
MASWSLVPIPNVMAITLLLTASEVAAAADHNPWRYQVKAGPAARELEVQLQPPAGAGPALVLDRNLGSFVHEAMAEDRAGTTPLERDGDRLLVPARCARRACTFRYRVMLEEAARRIDDRSRVFLHDSAIIGEPSAWLARPERPGDARFRLEVTTPPGIVFVSGIFPSREAPGAYEGRIDDLEQAPFSGFGAFETEAIPIGGSTLEVAIAPGERALGREQLVAWATRCARAVAAGYGRFPLPRAVVMVLPGGRRGVGSGTTMGNGGATILLSVGRNATTQALEEDWVLTHEMVHLALPNLPRRYHWLEEGIAVYMEPLLRARAGIIGPAKVWGDTVEGIPKGLPGRGDGGLDGTREWGRTYWGGALFCLLADLEIRERTHNRRSLDDALRGILDDGGSIAVSWSLERTLAAGDRATGTTVLRELHEKYGTQGGEVDLDRLWSQLGVRPGRGGVTFDDDAPLAAMRQAMTARASS